MSQLPVTASGSGLYSSHQLQFNPFFKQALAQYPSFIDGLPDIIYLSNQLQ
jgi:hypothetical protein